MSNKNGVGTPGLSGYTSQSVNGPLLELLECNLLRWRDVVEIQTVRIVLLLECGCSELLFLMVEVGPSLRVNPEKVTSNHDESVTAILTPEQVYCNFLGDRKTNSMLDDLASSGPPRRTRERAENATRSREDKWRLAQANTASRKAAWQRFPITCMYEKQMGVIFVLEKVPNM